MNWQPRIDVRYPRRVTHKNGYVLAVSVSLRYLKGPPDEHGAVSGWVGLAINGNLLPADSGFITFSGKPGTHDARSFFVFGDDIPGGRLIVCPVAYGLVEITHFQVVSSQIGA